MNSIEIICDCREDFPTKCPGSLWNDHLEKKSFQALVDAIRSLGYACDIFGGVPQLIHAYDQHEQLPDALFFNVSDGMTQPYSRTQIPILCDLLGIAYIGSGTFTATLATNKHYTKLALMEAGILCPRGVLMTQQNQAAALRKLQSVSMPVLLKPNTEGSSIGITSENICEDIPKTAAVADKMLQDFDEIVVEEYIRGYNATAFVIGNPGRFLLNEVLITQHHNKLCFENEVLGYQSYVDNEVSYLAADTVLAPEAIEKIKQIAEHAFAIIQAQDYIRIDFRVTQEGTVYLLEINTVPAIKLESQVGAICKLKQYTLSEFCQLIIHAAQDRLSHA